MCGGLLGSARERLSHLPPAPGLSGGSRASAQSGEQEQGLRSSEPRLAVSPAGEGWSVGRAQTSGVHHTTTHPPVGPSRPSAHPSQRSMICRHYSGNIRGQPDLRIYQKSSKWVEQTVGPVDPLTETGRSAQSKEGQGGVKSLDALKK